MYYRQCLTALFVFFSVAIHAQETDITGLWKGTIYNDTTQMNYQYEVGISKEKGKYLGFSHTWFILNDKQYYGVKKVKVTIANDGKIIIEDDGLISNNYPVPPNKNVRQLNVLTLDASSPIMTLKGLYRTNRTKEFHELTGSVSLQRKNDFWQSALIPHLEELGKASDLSFVRAEKEEKSRMASTALVSSSPKPISPSSQESSQGQAIVQKESAVKATTQKEAVASSAKKEKAAKQEERAQLKLATAMAKAASAAQEDAEKAALDNEVARAKEKKKEEAILAKQAALLAKQERDVNNAAENEKAKQMAAAAEEKASKATASVAIKTAEEKPETIKANQTKEYNEVAAPAPPKEQATKGTVTSDRGLVKPAAQVKERATIVQQTVSFTSDSLFITLYDNGEVDGDTVSVLLNGNIILEKQGLSTTAIKKTIYIPAHLDRMELVMYAESLGAIAPNTGLLVIRDGKQLYEVRFSGDLQKNASIVLNRKKE